VNIFERVVGGSVFGDVWHQFQQYLFNEKRWLELLSFKPIEIYTTKTDIEVDGAKIDLNIKAYIENIVQKRISNVRSYLTLGFLDWKINRQAYKFDVIIKAKAEYDSVANFFNHHFANQKYEIEENKYEILLKEFKIKSNGIKAQIDVPFVIHTHKWYLKKTYDGVATFNCSLVFNDPVFTIRTRNLSYTISTNSFLLRWIDSIYHTQIIDFLNSFLTYNFREELYLIKLQAQNQLNDFQVEKKWIQGNITDVQLERITIDKDALRGVFLANGRLEVNN
jgi:hypothetical protein